MKLTAILRIKDQIQTIDACMTRLSEVVDEICVVDNGSTDGTLEAYKKYPKIVSVQQSIGFDEGRDKIMVLDKAKKGNPDWILWCDADEILENHFTRKVADSYMNSEYDRITFRMCNFWLSETSCRYDGVYYLYTLHPQRSMWRNLPGAYFKNMKIHNGDIQGVTGPVYLSPYRLKHYGYAYKDKIEEKIRTYMTADPNGSRDYLKTIDPNLPYKTFLYIEFDNEYLNLGYVYFYKYLCNVLWLIERARLKFVKLFRR